MRLASLIAALVVLCSCGTRPAPSTQTAESVETKAGPAPARPAPDNRPVIVAFGDSLTAGFGAEPGKSYPDFLQQDLDRAGYRYRVVNAGISGETTSDALARLEKVTALNPAVVILEFGGNDGLRGLPTASTRSNMEQLTAGLKRSGAQVLLAGMTLPPNYGPDYIRRFEETYTGLAAKEKIPLIPFLLIGVAGTTRYMQQDGIHPTAEGNRLVAENVMHYLKPLLKRGR
ncbi:MAG: arylesterase [Bryobacteraceae bacterium]